MLENKAVVVVVVIVLYSTPLSYLDRNKGSVYAAFLIYSCAKETS